MAWNAFRRNGTALYDFAPNGEFQVPLVSGCKVEVFEESSGWYKGTVQTNPPKKGIFPASFVQLSQEIPDDPPPLPPTDDGAKARLEEIRREKARLQEEARKAQMEEQARMPPGKIKVFRAGSNATAGAGKRFAGKGFNPNAPSSAQAVAGAASPNGTAAPSGGAGVTLVAGPKPAPPPAAAAARPAANPNRPPPPHGPMGGNKPPPPQQRPGARPPPPSAAALHQKVSGDTTAPAAASAAAPAPAAPAAAGAARKPRTATMMPEEEAEEHHISHDITVEALFKEVSHCMTDWAKAMRAHLRGGQAIEYHRTMERMSSLLELRNKMLTERKADARERIRDQIIQLIESSRKAQEGFTVPRNAQGMKADTSNTGIVDLLQMHREMYDKVQQETNTPFKQQGARRRQTSIAATRAVISAAPSSRSPFPPGPMQMLLDVKMCIFSAGEDTEIYIYLWDQNMKQFITEAFVDVLTDQGLPEKRELIGDVRTVFQDLDSQDFSNLWVCAFVYRIGRLVYDPKKKALPKTDRRYRRPYGCAVINVTNLHLENKMCVEHSPPPATMYIPTKEEDFYHLHTIIMDDPKGLQEAPKAKGIVVGLTLFPGDKVNARVQNDDKKLNLQAVSGTDKFLFSEHMSAEEERNDFYVHVDRGTLLQGRKTSAMNVEVLMKVCDNTGRTIANCIRKAAGPAAEKESDFRSCVYYHQNDPIWNQTIKLSLEPDLFERCHILFTFWHVSSNKKPACISFAFLKLTAPSGAVIADGQQVLTTYDATAKVEKENANNGYYLQGAGADPKLVVRQKESITIRTKLTSTKKTQNDVLHSLFKWRKLDQSVLRAMLQKFTNIKQGGLDELSRFIRETFDAFFSILDSPQHQQLHMDVFDAFIHSLTLLTDKKIQKYRPIVDSYIANLMNSPQAHTVLLS